METKTKEMIESERMQNEAWAKVTAIWREARRNINSVTEDNISKQPTKDSLKRWVVSTSGLCEKASEAWEEASSADREWVKSANDSQIK